MKKFLLFILMSLCVFSVTAGTYVLEAEHLLSGDWQVKSGGAAPGGAMLYSPQKGVTASGKLKFPEAGNYYVFMRTMSYGERWRLAELYLDGKKIGSAGDEVFQDSKRSHEYTWGAVSQQPVAIKANTLVECKLVAAASNCRVDSILFTTSPDLLKSGSYRNLGKDEYKVLELAEKPEYSGELNINIRTEKNAVSYHCGEEIRFIIQPLCDGVPMKSGFVEWSIATDDGQKESGQSPITGQELAVSVVLKQPGFVRLKARLLDSRKNAIVSTKGKVILSMFDGGAGADIGLLKEMPEPKDFDEFWEKQKERLKAVPMKSSVISCEVTKDEKYEIFAVAVDCAGGRPATGYMTIPVNAKAKSLPIVIHLAGYGKGIPKRPEKAISANAIAFALNVHGVLMEQPRKYYDDYYNSIGTYALQESSDNPEESYFNGMVLRLLRTLEYLKSRPEWDGKNLTTIGGSQGGLQSIWAAALDHDVSKCISSITWGCNIGSWKLGYMKRDGVVLSYNGARGYYDAVHHAKRVKCPVTVRRIGLGDFTCPPSGIVRMYCNLNVPKEAIFYQNSSHSLVIPNCETFTVVGNPGK